MTQRAAWFTDTALKGGATTVKSPGRTHRGGNMAREKKSKVGRREFLKGVAAGAGTLAGTSALAASGPLAASAAAAVPAEIGRASCRERGKKTGGANVL